jgi:hypothetical protein
MSCPSYRHPLCLDQPDNIRRIVKTSNVLAVQFSPTFCHFLLPLYQLQEILSFEARYFLFWFGQYLLRGRSKV